MKKIIAMFLTAGTLSGCASGSQYQQMVSKQQSNEAVYQAVNANVRCETGKAVFYTELEPFGQKTIELKNGVIIGKEGNYNYFMYPDVPFLLKKFSDGTGMTEVVLIDDTIKLGTTYKEGIAKNVKVFNQICGIDSVKTIKNSDAANNFFAYIGMSYNPEKVGSLSRMYTGYKGYRAILKKHIPGYNDDKFRRATNVELKNPAETLAYFASNKDKLDALNADLEAYFGGDDYKSDKRGK